MRAVDYHLFSRKGKLYYRCSLPTNLKPFVPFNEIVLSLSTSDLAQGRLYVAKLDIEVKKLVAKIYNILEQSSPEEAIERVKSHVTGCLDDLRQSVGLYNIRKSPLWYSSALEAVEGEGIKANKSPLFLEVSEEYLKECFLNARKTLDYKRTSYDIFASMLGDIPIENVTKALARQYKQTLLKAPVNLLQKLSCKSYSEVDWTKLPEGKAQSFKTINGRISPLISLFEWAEKNDFYSDSNPFKGLLIKEAKYLSNKRDTYSLEDLQALFSCPVYSGCNGRKMPSRLEKGGNIYKDYIYWVPIIGLYSGMRLNEICQLAVSDIEQKEGIWCFNINDSEDKALKTIASNRIVPIHSKLLELGFIEYVLGQKHTRIFNEIERGYDGSYSYSFTKLYSRLLSRIKLKRKGLCFHSFRHTFIDALRNAGVERSKAMALVGHGSIKDIHSGYGDGYNLDILKKSIEKIDFQLPF